MLSTVKVRIEKTKDCLVVLVIREVSVYFKNAMGDQGLRNTEKKSVHGCVMDRWPCGVYCRGIMDACDCCIAK